MKNQISTWLFALVFLLVGIGCSPSYATLIHKTKSGTTEEKILWASCAHKKFGDSRGKPKQRCEEAYELFEHQKKPKAALEVLELEKGNGDLYASHAVTWNMAVIYESMGECKEALTWYSVVATGGREDLAELAKHRRDRLRGQCKEY